MGLPNGWERGGEPDKFYYEGQLVISNNKGRGLIELMTKIDGERISATSTSLKSAMRDFEEEFEQTNN